MSINYEFAEANKDGHKYVMITGYEGKVTDLMVPDVIEGVAVEVIGNHAFSGRQDLISVTIPESVRTIYGFAFHNCRNLRKITLFDSIDDYYDGVCRQCDNLEEVEITVNNSWYEVIRNFLADNDKTLRFLIHSKKSDDEYSTSCLVFPEYVYDFNENTMARTIQFSIAGSGYAFRECVDRRKIDYRQYDSLFAKAIIDGGEIAEDIAIYRTLYPMELEERFGTVYEKYIRDNAGRILERLVKKCSQSMNSTDSVSLLKTLIQRKGLFNADVMDKAVELSVNMQNTVVTALLMAENGSKRKDTVSEFVF
ncbi:MAG: leucine-rich repeat domain-containing protein [Butyrivibrio sp.]|nr:leucine-rich repeat domain-containing protein [Butyrivibrio sp.]